MLGRKKRSARLRYLHHSIFYPIPCDRIVQKAYLTCLVTSLIIIDSRMLSFSETQGQLVRAGKSLNGREKIRAKKSQKRF